MASPASVAGSGASGDAARFWTAEHLAAAAAERALAIALACAQGLGQYRWEGTLRTARIMADATWDLFPIVAWDHTPVDQPAC